jgi:hypothetical protein
MAAIYMWFESELQVFTTTLYPVEVADSMQLSADISAGSLTPVPYESLDLSGDIASAAMPVILISYGPDNESHDISGDLTSVTLYPILITYGPDNEDHDNSGDLVSVTKPLKLVTVDTPDEKLQLTVDVYPSACSMTVV